MSLKCLILKEKLTQHGARRTISSRRNTSGQRGTIRNGTPPCKQVLCNLPKSNPDQPLRESARPQADNRSAPNGIRSNSYPAAFFMAAPKEAIDMQPESRSPKKIIRLRGVIARSGLSKTTIYRISNDPASDFPKPVRPTPHTVGWYESEIDAWVDSRRGGAA